MKRVLVIDGHNYLYKSYYGVPSAARLSNGLQVNAFYGFFSSLRKIIKNINPENTIVVFDSETGIKGKVKSNINYKANRKYYDNGMYLQLPLIKKALDLLCIPWIEHAEYEADDIIGSIASCEYSKGNRVYIGSQDKDFFQLINERITILRFEKGDIVEYSEDSFNQVYGFGCNKYLDYLALTGDSSDNIKGIKGIGRTTATKIIKESIDLKSIGKKFSHDRLNTYYENIKFLKINSNVKVNYVPKQDGRGIIDLSSNELLSKIL